MSNVCEIYRKVLVPATMSVMCVVIYRKVLVTATMSVVCDNIFSPK